MQVKLWRAVFMWLLVVRKTIMPLEHNLSFVFSQILVKQSLIKPYKAYKGRNCMSREN